MTPDELLVHTLAHVDAIFRPHRRTRHNAAAAAAIFEARSAYRKSGLALSSIGTTRREAAGAIDELVRAGHAITFQLTHQHIQLTPTGDDYARHLADAPRLTRVWPLLEAVAAFTDAEGANSGYVLEHDLMGIDPRRSTRSTDLWPALYFAAPLLARGWLKWATDTQGRIGYGITTRGREALAAGCPSLPAYTAAQRYSDLYDDVYDRVLEERESWSPEADNHVLVPLSAGKWPTRRPIPGERKFHTWLKKEST